MPFLIRILTIFSLICCAQTLLATESIDNFAKLPAFSNPKISPDGKKIAATVIYQGRPLLITRNMDGSGGMSAIKVGSLYLHKYIWANNERLIVSARSSVDNWGGKWNIVRMAAVNADGSDPIFLPMYKGIYGYIQYAKVINRLPDEPEYVLAIVDREHEQWFSKVSKINIYTGEKETFQRNHKEIQSWLTDHQGRLRLAMRYDYLSDGTSVRIWHKMEKKENFELLAKNDYFENERVQPVFFDEENPKILTYITDSSFGELSDSDDYMDQLLAMNVETGELLGRYIEPYREKVYADAEKAFGDDVQFYITSHTDDKQLAIISVSSDIKPREFYLYNGDSKTFSFLASSYPQLKGVQLAPMLELSYTARDGKEIPAYVTYPAKKKDDDDQPSPLVVMPHGGPYARDYWGFDNYVQFLASQGYIVLQPQFRGSTGFGVEHEESGYGEWGNKIQDDITDGVKWMIESANVDPDKICIMGASFGGYAATMGTVRTPDLYKCAIAINGVHDLPQMLLDHRRLLYSTINKMVSNEYGNAKEFSPKHQAKKVVTPTLLIATEEDSVVPVEHSRDFYKKLKRLKRDVEYIEYEGGEHWRTDENIEIKTLRAIGVFLEKHLGEG